MEGGALGGTRRAIATASWLGFRVLPERRRKEKKPERAEEII